VAEVQLEGVTKLYGRKKAVDGVSITCKEGEFLSIFGPTGAGKSTILKMVAGIESITSGTIRFDGKAVNELPPQERNVSMAFESYNLYPHMNVYENIAFPLRARRWGLKLSPAEEQKKVVEIAEFLGIGQLLERLPQHLSGGQKQRVSLSRALVRRPEVYLLDEPIAHLDARLKFSTQTLLKEFASRYGSTIIYVTHDYREALALSHRILVLRRGRIEQMGTPQEVFNAPATDFVGRLIGEPPMNLIDGEATTRGGEDWFQVGDRFGIPVRGPCAKAMRACIQVEGGKAVARLGIRAECIRLSRTQPAGGAAFQLSVYAVVQEAQSTVVTFELPGSFFYARVRQEVGSALARVGESLWVELDAEKIFFFPRTVSLSSRA
jgi:multiple sugar transport system ATP-binding protein